MHRWRLSVITGVVAALLLSTGCSTQPRKVVDQDGNSYPAVQTGSMLWTGKNLDVITITSRKTAYYLESSITGMQSTIREALP